MDIGIKSFYRKIVPYELRFWFYMLRNPQECQSLRTKVNPSPKGDFSLRSFERYKCIFIHVTKSAGTSIAKSLFNELPYHYTAIQYRVIFGRKTFENYFKFAFVRNPWDRLYSAYSYLCGGGWDKNDAEWYRKNLSRISDFNAFVLDWLEPENLKNHLHLMPQSHFICDSRDRPLLDYLGYFETLPKDFDYISQQIGCKGQLSHFNASKRKNYTEVYSKDAIEKVGFLYRRDIVNFGYEFDRIKNRMNINNRKFVASE